MRKNTERDPGARDLSACACVAAAAVARDDLRANEIMRLELKVVTVRFMFALDNLSRYKREFSMALSTNGNGAHFRLGTASFTLSMRRNVSQTIMARRSFGQPLQSRQAPGCCLL